MADIDVRVGGDYTIPITVTDSDGNAVDITGETIFFTVKTDVTVADANATISKDITSHSDPTNGVTSLVLTDDDTDVSPGAYVFDFKRKTAAGLFVPYTTGTFGVLSTVTIRES